MHARLLHPNCALLITKSYIYATIAKTETFVTAGLDSLVMEPDLNWARGIDEGPFSQLVLGRAPAGATIHRESACQLDRATRRIA
jgi:hypothetical protein